MDNTNPQAEFSDELFAKIGEEIREINAKNGWNLTKPEDWEDEYKIPACIALIISEASEALEAFRKDDKENFKEEFADIFIRLASVYKGLGFDDFYTQIQKKLEKNKTRGYRHGGKKV